MILLNLIRFDLFKHWFVYILGLSLDIQLMLRIYCLLRNKIENGTKNNTKEKIITRNKNKRGNYIHTYRNTKVIYYFFEHSIPINPAHLLCSIWRRKNELEGQEISAERVEPRDTQSADKSSVYGAYYSCRSSHHGVLKSICWGITNSNNTWKRWKPNFLSTAFYVHWMSVDLMSRSRTNYSASCCVFIVFLLLFFVALSDLLLFVLTGWWPTLSSALLPPPF